jgi:hypothetical protein
MRDIVNRAINYTVSQKYSKQKSSRSFSREKDSILQSLIRLTFVFLALFLASCAGIPAEDIYRANPADVGPGNPDYGCNCVRVVGDRSIIVTPRPSGPQSPDAKLSLIVSVSSIVRVPGGITEGPLTESVFVDASRIRLEEGGKTLSGRFVKSERQSKWAFSAYITFNAPSGVDDNLRIVFLPGAIKIGGRSVPFAPIRFKKVTIAGKLWDIPV